MSASTIPTSAPPAARAAARLAESVDLPTPPFPDASATTRVRALSEIAFCSAPFPPGCSRWRSAAFSWGLITSNATPTDPTPSTDPRCRRIGRSAVHEFAERARPVLVARRDRACALVQVEGERRDVPRDEGRAGLA